MASRLIRSERVVFADGVRPATIRVAGRPHQSIVAVGTLRHRRQRPGASTVIDAGSAVVMPGLVDTHVHINDPGRADWEGFETATLAAAAGGVTTLVDMPLNSIPPTTTVAALEAKRRAAAGPLPRRRRILGRRGARQCSRHRAARARRSAAASSVSSVPSGVDEFAHVSEADLARRMPIVAATGLPLLVHAEWPALLRAARSTRRSAPLCDLARQPADRPPNRRRSIC